ncbi:hypothetical protein [Mycobacterium sp. CnD-18-1]|uniref:hypothetical protein n=1 Tax=Mycobacterium sp. CnD-18-1 TaxID=2917744 RepID=UPI001EF38F96|nr:hypothetical protein [Mycobacterium sp. CnD-18-1]MCG7607099.1 hypothetical protein [Mycobacterium sp. CnD-18-1]
MADTGSLHIDITPKIRKVTALVDLYVDGRSIGTTEVDVTHLLTGGESAYAQRKAPDERPDGIPGKTGTRVFNVNNPGPFVDSLRDQTKRYAAETMVPR